MKYGKMWYTMESKHLKSWSFGCVLDFTIRFRKCLCYVLASTMEGIFLDEMERTIWKTNPLNIAGVIYHIRMCSVTKYTSLCKSLDCFPRRKENTFLQYHEDSNNIKMKRVYSTNLRVCHFFSHLLTIYSDENLW